MLVRPTIIVVFDAVKDAITVVTPVRPKGTSTRSRHWRAPSNASPTSSTALDRPLDKSLAERDAGPHRRTGEIEHHAATNTGRMVRKAKEYIVAGDVFQVVLAQRFEAPFALPPFSLYRALRRTNPSPYPVLSRFRRLRCRRIESRKSW